MTVIAKNFATAEMQPYQKATVFERLSTIANVLLIIKFHQYMLSTSLRHHHLYLIT